MKTFMVALLVLAAAAPAAAAATIESQATSRQTGEHEFVRVNSVAWSSEPSDRSDADVRIEAGNAVAVRDDGAPIGALAGCAEGADRWVRCAGGPSSPWPVPLLLRAQLGDGDDWIRLTVVPNADENADGQVTFEGGAGDDRIEAANDSPGTLPLTLDGGIGDDTLAGGPGADALFGGDGADVADYWRSPRKVTVDLAAGTADDGDGVDRLTSVEGVVGSEHAELIRGGDGDDWLRSHQGRDVFEGRGGDDRIEGGFVAFASGGPGDDSISVTGSERRIACGPGRDRITLREGAGAVPKLWFPSPDCEQLALRRFTLTRFASRPRAVRMTVEAVNAYCSLTVRLRNARGAAIATVRRGLRASLRHTVVLRPRRAVPAGATAELVPHSCGRTARAAAAPAVVLTVRPR